MRIEALRNYQRHNRQGGYFDGLSPEERARAQRWLGLFITRRRTRGLPLPQWLMALYYGQAKRLAIQRPDSGWGRSMLAKRGGYAVQQQYRREGRNPTRKATHVRLARQGSKRDLEAAAPRPTKVADRYLASRRLELALSSQAKERQLLVRPREFLQAAALNRINAERVLAYREWRAAQGVGPAIINMEVGVLRRILRRAKRWHLIAEDVKPLREPRSIGRALTLEEKLKLLKTASQKPEWETACWAAILAFNTTLRKCELRGLQWTDINLIDRLLTVRKSKTPAGERVIPLTQDAYDALLRFRKRAEMFGPVESTHYVFAGFHPRPRFHGKKFLGMKGTDFDPTRPVKSWNTAWRSLTRKAGLEGFRFHDTRHHAITELAEGGASEQTIMAIAGHVSRQMLERYSHVRLEAKRKALEALSRQPAGSSQGDTQEGSYGTRNATNNWFERPMEVQVVEK